MACFLVPAGEAVVTSIVTKTVKTHEEKAQFSCSGGSVETPAKLRLSTKLGWLNKMLWGGSALLAFEHLWHGEIAPAFPFLTAIQTGETAEMLTEMGSVGILMAVLVTAVWGGMVAVSSAAEKQALREPGPAEEGVSA